MDPFWNQQKNNDEESFFSLAELMLNFFKLADRQMENNMLGLYWNLRDEWYLLHNIIDDDLERLNHKAIYNVETEQVLVVEDNPVATFVAEIVELDLTQDDFRYQNHLLKGDIDAKTGILFRLGKELEPKKKELEDIYKDLSDDIFFMLNKMNIRHNNLTSDNINEQTSWLSKLGANELETWYDELYQIMLIAFLLLDDQERHKKIKELKQETKKCKR